MSVTERMLEKRKTIWKGQLVDRSFSIFDSIHLDWTYSYFVFVSLYLVIPCYCVLSLTKQMKPNELHENKTYFSTLVFVLAVTQKIHEQYTPNNQIKIIFWVWVYMTDLICSVDGSEGCSVSMQQKFPSFSLFSCTEQLHYDLILKLHHKYSWWGFN